MSVCDVCGCVFVSTISLEPFEISSRHDITPSKYLNNKYIGDDTKAAARQSPNCIKKQKINKIWRKTIFHMADGILTPCNVAGGFGMTCH